MPKSRAQKLEWQFAQSFGTDGFCEDDVFAAVEFDATGDRIALGDQAGRITVFEIANGGGRAPSSTSDPQTGRTGLIEYEFYTEFQSHERDFDRLHSVEIEESINCIRWYKGSAHGNFLLSANDQLIKFWKVASRPLRLTPEEREEMQQQQSGTVGGGGGGGDVGGSTGAGGGPLRLPPRTATKDYVPQASCKRQFKHTSDNTHIETVSMCSDGETFLSADPLNINLWHLEHTDQCFNTINIKPDNLEELTEVITCADFHPRKCNVLAYGTSDGIARMADLRESALVNRCTRTFTPKRASKEFSEITQSLSDVRFTPDGRHIVTRDYLTTKVWDVKMERKPLLSLHVHEYLEEYLGALHQNDCIFDKFDCCVSPDGERVVTGSYDSNFVTHSIGAGSQSAKSSTLSETVHATSAPSRRKNKSFSFSRSKEKDRRARVAKMDFAKKALHTAWHPRMNAVAVASLNKVYIYQASPN